MGQVNSLPSLEVFLKALKKRRLCW